MLFEAKRFTFRKSERLCGGKAIEDLYKSNSSKLIFPYKVFWRISSHDEASNCRILISVPKRFFRKAVERNLIKRRIREAYRLSKPEWLVFLVEQNIKLDLAIIYIDKKALPFASIQKSIGKMITYLREEICSQKKKNQ